MPLDLDKLSAVRTLVCHRYADRMCPDGLASAIILKDVLLEAEVVFVTHGTELAELEAKPNMLFCDIAPTPERAHLFREQGAIVLDHHHTARAVVESFGALGVYGDGKGESGAVLAFYSAWMPLAFRGAQRPAHHWTEGRGASTVRTFAELAGIRDTWQRTDPRWYQACCQAEALTFWPPEYLPIGTSFTPSGYSESMRQCLEIGPVLLEKREAETKRQIAAGWRHMTAQGTKVLIVPTVETSDVAEAVGPEVDLVVGFQFVKGKEDAINFILSTRSHASFDCAAFCKAFGGGGHKAAAGCVIELAWFACQPVNYILEILEGYEHCAP